MSDAPRKETPMTAGTQDPLAALVALAEKWEEQVGWGGDGYDSSDQKVAWVREIRSDLAAELRALLPALQAQWAAMQNCLEEYAVGFHEFFHRQDKSKSAREEMLECSEPECRRAVTILYAVKAQLAQGESR